MPNEALLLVLILTIAVVAAYFYVRRRQGQTGRTAADRDRTPRD